MRWAFIFCRWGLGFLSIVRMTLHCNKDLITLLPTEAPVTRNHAALLILVVSVTISNSIVIINHKSYCLF